MIESKSVSTQPGAVTNELASKQQVLGAARALYALLIGVALLTVLLDQWSKIWIRANLAPGDNIAVWPGVFHLSHVWNRGAAWGMLSGQRVILVAVTLLVLFGAASMTKEFVRRGKMAVIGMGFIVGGAIGNLIDRVLFGHVTDMIDVDTPIPFLQTFPVFNLADSALTVGVCILLIQFLFSRPDVTD